MYQLIWTIERAHFSDVNIPYVPLLDIIFSYVIRSIVMRHGGSHASGVCLNGNLHREYIVFVRSLVYDFTASRDLCLC